MDGTDSGSTNTASRSVRKSRLNGRSETTSGSPQAIASTVTFGSPSARLGSTKKSAADNHVGRSLLSTGPAWRTAGPRGRCGPLPRNTPFTPCSCSRARSTRSGPLRSMKAPTNAAIRASGGSPRVRRDSARSSGRNRRASKPFGR